MDIGKRLRNHYKRWNINISIHDEYNKFKNRLLDTTDKVLGLLILKSRFYDEYFTKILGVEASVKSIYGTSELMKQFAVLSRGIYGIPPRSFERTVIYKYFRACDELNSIVTGIQVLFIILEQNSQYEIMKEYAEAIKHDIDLSNINIRVAIYNEKVLLYPKGARLLDDRLVNDNLIWLENYPKVLEHFESALNQYHLGNLDNCLHGLRKTLEIFIKAYLPSKRRDFKRLIEELTKHLKSKLVHKQIRKIYHDILMYYNEYQNDAEKHGDNYRPEDIEFIIYQTGSLIRFLITIE